jgi:hypothetical protein
LESKFFEFLWRDKNQIGRGFQNDFSPKETLKNLVSNVFTFYCNVFILSAIQSGRQSSLHLFIRNQSKLKRNLSRGSLQHWLIY